jgi:epoxyqueuosine reductase
LPAYLPIEPILQLYRRTGFYPRQKLDKSSLLELFEWTEEEFLKRTEGSAIRRTGYIGWLRNIAVALGNSSGGEVIEAALKKKLEHPSGIVREHAEWAFKRLQKGEIPQALPIDKHFRRDKLIF